MHWHSWPHLFMVILTFQSGDTDLAIFGDSCWYKPIPHGKQWHMHIVQSGGTLTLRTSRLSILLSMMVSARYSTRITMIVANTWMFSTSLSAPSSNTVLKSMVLGGTSQSELNNVIWVTRHTVCEDDDSTDTCKQGKLFIRYYANIKLDTITVKHSQSSDAKWGITALVIYNGLNVRYYLITQMVTSQQRKTHIAWHLMPPHEDIFSK